VTAELTGTYTGRSNTYIMGEGDRSYSWALAKPVASSGDVWLEVRYSDDGTPSFRLNGYRIADSGISLPALSSLDLPREFATEKWIDKKPKAMLIGHCYVLLDGVSGRVVLIQILDFQWQESKKASYDPWTATCTLKFRHLPPASSIDGLRKSLADNTVGATGAAVAGRPVWTEAVLAGMYKGKSNRYIQGKEGASYYSLALAKPVASSGDVWLEVLYSDDGTPSFRLNGYWIADLGISLPALSSLDLPREFATVEWFDKEPKVMLIGHYYVLLSGVSGRIVLIQILDFQWQKSKKASYDPWTATCTLKFRHLPPASSIDGLRKSLAAVGVGDGVAHADPQPGPKPAPKPEPSKKPDPGAEDQLLVSYEGFQKDAKTFMDSKPPEATVKGCDALQTGASELDAQIRALLATIDAQVKKDESTIRALQDRLDSIKELQIQDNIKTIIAELTKAVQERQLRQKEWEARKTELLTAQKSLSKYREILEILETK